MAYDILKDQGVDILPYFKKADELKRGDVSKSIQCYKHEAKVFEEKVYDHIRNLIGNTRKKNDYQFACNSKTLIGVAMNLARMTHDVGDHVTKDKVKSILIEPLL
ncbi:hypothetical protein SADUNF_Sadunf19G0011200 [Salix dunnii]|uniref:Uncharacterized protein n=1 Tax=Salix dunnii TaxID=1413687 RepID=A0A835J2M0_9ROSI|nr:hypothetical protein SADUNF_Sadunf19G0011200 [Salix dunnii]